VDPAALLRTVRRRRGLTQAELALRAGVSQPVISAYERGRRDPTYSTLRKLVAASGEQLVLGAVATSNGPRPAVDAHEHAARLLDVLSLADAIPVRRRPEVLAAPRLVSR
jgi:transcriptional regulator with XRE-family HTH domain